MNETAKAMRRRFVEDRTDKFPWMRVFQGDGIDIGCGPDKLPFDRCIGFDKADGDANHVLQYFSPGTFRYVHSSQSLEHMVNPFKALTEWLKIVKKGGHVVFTVPDWCLYEHMIWPSKFNPDHKSTWSMHLRGSYAPQHVYIPEFLSQVPGVNVLRSKLVDTNYDYSKPPSVDQTYFESDGVEAFIEVVLKKTT